MQLSDLQTLAKPEKNESRFTLPKVDSRLGEAITDILSVIHEQSNVRWGQVEELLKFSGNLDKRAANRHLKNLAEHGTR